MKHYRCYGDEKCLACITEILFYIVNVADVVDTFFKIIILLILLVILEKSNG